MKKVGFIYFTLVFVASLIFLSCSNDDTVEDKGTNEMQLSMDDINLIFNSNNTQFVTYKSFNEFGMVQLSIEAQYLNEMGFVIQIPAYTGSAVYKLNAGDHMGLDVKIHDFKDGSSWFMDFSDSESLNFNEIQILEDNGKTVTGDFSFNISNSSNPMQKKVVQGFLNLEY